MGRLGTNFGRRRVLVGLLGVGALALAACTVPMKPAPPEDTPTLPDIEICAPVAAPRAELVPAPDDPPCVPLCLPGQEPTQPPALGVETADGECVPICNPFESDPEAKAELVQRCVNIPIPCLPGQEDPREALAQALRTLPCVNFCLPGEQPPAEVAAELERPCVPLCVFAEVIRGLPGLEPCPDER